MNSSQTIEIVLSSITFLLNFYLGLMVLLQNSKSWTNRLFFALTIFINGYVVTNYLSLHPPSVDPETQLLWIRIVMAEAAFLGPTLLLLVHTFPRKNISMNRYLVIGIIVYAIFTFALCLSPFVFSSIEYPEGKPIPVPGPAIPVFFIDFAGLFLASFVVLFLKLRRSIGIERIQHMYFLIGILLTFTSLTVFTTVFVVILRNSDLVFLGPIFSLFLVAFIAAAIIKHRFLDIRLLVARAISYSLLIFTLAVIYVVGSLVAGIYFFGYDITLGNLIIPTVLTLLIVFTFQPLLRFFEKITNNIFYKDRYIPGNLLSKIGKTLTSHIQLNDLVDSFFSTLLSEMKVRYGILFLVQDSKIIWSRVSGNVDENFEIKEEKINFLVKEAASKTGNEQFFIFEELAEGRAKQYMREKSIYAFFPLLIQDEVVGCVLFGEKSSGNMYSTDDINVLQILAPQLAVTVKNAQSYEEIRRFNITLQQEVEKATSNLRFANTRLKELDKVKDEFVYMASHELRTPMTAIKSYLWLALNKHADKNDGPLTQDLTRAYISTERLIRLVQDMLTVSRIEGKRLTLDVKPVKMGAAAQQIVDELASTAKDKQLNLTFAPSSEEYIVNGDQTRIMEVLQNFIGNSLKFTPAGGSITVSIKRNGQMIETNVTDTGVGIPADDLPRLFQKFGRLGHSYKRMTGETGTGLGLFISKQIVEAHGGKIWATSEVDHGSTFTFSLPEYKGSLEPSKGIDETQPK